MNITNIKNEIKNFMNTNMNVEVVEMTYIPGVVRNSFNEYTGEEFEEKTDDTMNIVLSEDFKLNEETNQKLFDFETYIYLAYHNLNLNYNVKPESAQ